MKIFVLYRLKDGVSFDTYKRWSLGEDQPTLRVHTDVARFSVYATTAADASTAPYDVVEEIEVADLEAWTRVTESSDVKALGPAFEGFVDPDSVCILLGEEIAE
ncbi:MAG: hypothetical protein E6G14_13455 [Actinobacteria bacterium]|nr:MAG: hypothetical protein E6G14_13455 [Actinomycetota bacterium]